MKKKAIIVIGFIFLCDLICLVVFGILYTKQTLFSPYLYAHDVVLTMMTAFSVWFFCKENREKSFEMLSVMAIAYLIISFIRIDFDFTNSYILIRQFMIFGYGICIYVIMNALFGIRTIKENSAKIVMYFGALCITVQMIYVIYLFLNQVSPVFFERNYLSPIAVMGFFIAASYVLTNFKGWLVKHGLFLLVFLMSFSTGHDSTYLSLALIYFSYIFIVCSRKYKLVLSVFLILGVLAVIVFLPSFTDVNVQWRLIYWQDSLIRIANNYFIFGDGFGVPYAFDETVLKLNQLYPGIQHSPVIMGDENYLTAPHNSFLTMAIHLGLLSLILLFYPLKPLFSNKKLIMDREILFLSLSLLGIVVFSYFNVVLELPHASSIFWIILFVLIFKLSEKSELPSHKSKL